MTDQTKRQRSLDLLARGESLLALGRKIKPGLLFLTHGETLLALVFVLAGIIVLREGFLKLRALWIQVAPLFPLSIPEYSSQRLLMGLPQLVSLFINVVSSLCAVLIGLLWAASGLADALQSLKKPVGHPNWQDAGIVAEVVQTAQAQVLEVFFLADAGYRGQIASTPSYQSDFIRTLTHFAQRVVENPFHRRSDSSRILHPTSRSFTNIQVLSD